MTSRIILHVDFNSYFATVEQQANPRLRGKPIGVTGGDRTKRTVIGAASIEAKQFGVKTGMQLYEARKLCPQIILVRGDSEKYLECTKRFLNILKDYSPYLEVFSIDEVFLELPLPVIARRYDEAIQLGIKPNQDCFALWARNDDLVMIAQGIKKRIKSQIGEWLRVSIGISYNKLMAKLAGSLQKPDGLIVIPDQKTAIEVLDKVSLDEICGIGYRIKSRLNKLGIFNFKQLRQVPLEILLFEFKSYGQFLYNGARGIDTRPIIPFYEKEEVKSVGHRLTMNRDSADPVEIKQILLKLTELIARKLRAKKLVGRTVSCWFRHKLEYNNIVIANPEGVKQSSSDINQTSVADPTKIASSPIAPRNDVSLFQKPHFEGGGMQSTILYTSDGLDIFKAAWSEFLKMWNPSTPFGRSGQVRPIRMIGASISNLKPATPETLSFLDEIHRREIITSALDKINNKYGEFTLTRGILLGTPKIRRMPNSFLADRRFKI
jgi:DNA polymerase IV